MRSVPIVPVLVLFLLPPSLASAAQTAVPVQEEPKHHLVFETPWVRVIDARLPPGYVSLYHVHARDNVPVAIEGGPIEVQLLGGEPTRVEVASGSVSFASGGYTHRVSNLGSEPVRFIDVAIVSAPPGGDEGASDPLVGHRLELENERVRVYRVRLAPGEEGPAHRHDGAVLGVVVRGEKRNRGNDEGRPSGPGGFRWYEEGSVPTITAAGEAPLELVEIELR